MKNNISKLHGRALKQSEVEPNPLIQKFLKSERTFPCFQRLPEENHSTVTLMKIRSSFQFKHRRTNSSYASRQILTSRTTKIWKLTKVLFFPLYWKDQSVLFTTALAQPGIKENHCFSLTPFCHHKASHSVTFCKLFLLESSKILHTMPSASTIRVQYTSENSPLLTFIPIKYIFTHILGGFQFISKKHLCFCLQSR